MLIWNKKFHWLIILCKVRTDLCLMPVYSLYRVRCSGLLKKYKMRSLSKEQSAGTPLLPDCVYIQTVIYTVYHVLDLVLQGDSILSLFLNWGVGGDRTTKPVIGVWLAKVPFSHAWHTSGRLQAACGLQNTIYLQFFLSYSRKFVQSTEQ